MLPVSTPVASRPRPFIAAFLGAALGVLVFAGAMLAVSKCPPVPAPASTIAPVPPTVSPKVDAPAVVAPTVVAPPVDAAPVDPEVKSL